MVGDSLESIEALIVLAKKHNLNHLQVGNVTIAPSDKPVAPQISLEDLAKMQKQYDDAKVSDEDILMNPYAGMNNLPMEGKEI